MYFFFLMGVKKNKNKKYENIGEYEITCGQMKSVCGRAYLCALYARMYNIWARVCVCACVYFPSPLATRPTTPIPASPERLSSDGNDFGSARFDK